MFWPGEHVLRFYQDGAPALFGELSGRARSFAMAMHSRSPVASEVPACALHCAEIKAVYELEFTCLSALSPDIL